MSRSTLAVWAVIGAFSAILLTTSARRAIAARREADRAVTSLVSFRADLAELRTLRATTTALAPENGDLATRVGEVLAAAGLPASTLVSLPTPTDAVVATTGELSILRRSCTLTLQGATLPQIGGFLDAWRKREPNWTVTRIELVPVQTRALDTPATGGDRPLRATLTIETITQTQRPTGGRR